jgi:uncharacterized protein YjhX (UPF0386 family)
MKLTNLQVSLSFLLLVSLASAQPITFGKLNAKDVSTKECSFEKDAPALVLADIGHTDFVRTEQFFYIKHFRHTRIKIFNEAGYDYAEIAIPIRKGKDDFEVVKDIQGITYNMTTNGLEKTSLNVKQVYKENLNDYVHDKILIQLSKSLLFCALLNALASLIRPYLKKL